MNQTSHAARPADAAAVVHTAADLAALGRMTGSTTRHFRVRELFSTERQGP